LIWNKWYQRSRSYDATVAGMPRPEKELRRQCFAARLADMPVLFPLRSVVCLESLFHGTAWWQRIVATAHRCPGVLM
jgi:hypothetical protein